MTKKDAGKWYESLPVDVRMKLLRDFDTIYDNLGSSETKFFKWLMSFKKETKKKYVDNN